MKIIVIITLISLLILSCNSDDNCHDELTFSNNSTEDLYFGFDRGDLEKFSCQTVMGKLNSGEFYTQLLSRSCWENRINGSYRGSLAVYYFLENPNSTSIDCNKEELNLMVTQAFTQALLEPTE